LLDSLLQEFQSVRESRDRLCLKIARSCYCEVLIMAASNSSLVEGLEDISEEEQLKLALEMSKNDMYGSDFGNSPINMSIDSVRSDSCQLETHSDRKFEEWCATPAEDRLQYLVGQNNVEEMDAVTHGNAVVVDDEDAYESDEDQELLRIIEQSKTDNHISEEEKTKLALEQSKLDTHPMGTLSENEQLEVALKMSLRASQNQIMFPPRTRVSSSSHNEDSSSESPPPITPLALTPPLSISPPTNHVPDLSVRPKTRPATVVTHHKAVPEVQLGPGPSSPPLSPQFRVPPPPVPHIPPRVKNQIHITSPNRFSPLAASPPPSSPLRVSEEFPPLSEEEQLEMALKLSQEEAEGTSKDLRQMSEDDQLKLAMRLSRSESASTVGFSVQKPGRQKRLSGSGAGGAGGANGAIGLGGPGHARVLSPLAPSQSSPSLPSQFVQRKPTQSSVAGPVLSRPVLTNQPAPSNQPLQLPGETLRHIVVDGSNVGMAMGKNEVFRAQALSIVYGYFAGKNHEVTIFLPKSRWNRASPKDRELLDRLEKKDVLHYTPTRRTDTKSFDCYDDRYIVSYAANTKGIIVTNDNYRDLLSESPEFRDQIENRLLPFTWVRERFMPPEDPLGKGGPRLSEFLRH